MRRTLDAIVIPHACVRALTEAERLTTILLAEGLAGEKQWSDDGTVCELSVTVDWINISTAGKPGMIGGAAVATCEIETQAGECFTFQRVVGRENEWHIVATRRPLS